MKNEKRKMRRAAGCIVVHCALLGLVGTAPADDLVRPELSRVKLRPHAEVCGPTVTLADVLDFSQADPRLSAEVGHKPVNPELHPPVETTVTHEQVIRRLDELSVNLARVLVSGAARCHVTLEPGQAQTGISPTIVPAGDGPAEHATLIKWQPGGQGNTLADALRAYVGTELASLGGTAETEFERAGQEFLALTRPPWEFAIRATGGDKLGLREFDVAIRRDGRTHLNVLMVARVRLAKQVLVARKPLGIGNFVRQADVGFEPRIFDRLHDIGLDDVGQLIGQQVRRYIPVGEMVRRSDIKAIDLVKRSRPVSITSSGNAVSVYMTGVALDSGGYGDTVRVRIGDSRKDRRTLRGVVTSVGSVRLIDDGA
jgi:flagella basal body P-ring formation protein FlgA